MTTLDFIALFGFLIVVAVVSLLAARGERSRTDYFLAGRRLTWWLIGFSLIASNISTEHFVGMTGTASARGLAVAGYEWVAAAALVFVAWWLLPRFLRSGIYTIPQFLEIRFDRSCRTILAALMAVFFVLTVLATVLYSGATFLSQALALPEHLGNWFGIEDATEAESFAFSCGVWGIGIFAGIYTIIGGLKAVVWSDLLQGAALLLGGGVVAILALDALGAGAGIFEGWSTFVADRPERFDLVRPFDDPDLPGPALLTGIWIPVMFYWGLNQFITQRTLAAGSLAEGQRGLLFAAVLKIFLPLIIVLPGMMAATWFASRGLEVEGDATYPRLVRELLPSGAFGLMLAAIAGSIMSTFNSGLNSAATVVTLDLWVPRRGQGMDEQGIVRTGRIITALLAILACLWAPVIQRFDGVFSYIQELWGFVSAPTCAVFFVGLVFPHVRAPAARQALFIGPTLYLISRVPGWIWGSESSAVHAEGGLASWLLSWSELSFLFHMFGIFLALVGWMLLVSGSAEQDLEEDDGVVREIAPVDLTPMPRVHLFGGLILAVVLAIYLALW